MSTFEDMLKLAVEHHHRGRLVEADKLYRQVLAADPLNIDALQLFGVLASQVGNYPVAVDYIGRAIRLNDQQAVFFVNLGEAYRKWGRPEEALAAASRAVALDPNFAEAHNTLGTVFLSQRRYAEALASYARSIELAPDCARGHCNIAPLLAERGEYDRALAHLSDALRLEPNMAEAHVNRAVLLLSRGDLAAGWQEFAWRLQLPDAARPAWPQPLWDGSPLEGRTLVLCPDHGLGDALQCIRYAPLVKARGATVVLFCHARLAPILGTCPGIDRVVTEGQALGPFDVYAPLLSLPGLVQTTLETIPAQVPYLAADQRLVEHWRNVLPPDGRLRVGINWQGNPSYPRDDARSFRLAEFAALAQIAGVRLVSLQKGAGSEQLAEAPFDVEDLGSQLDEQGISFCDTAAVIENLDLVITSDTALAHLAGALGAGVWLALPRTADWRWLIDRADSPWYPSMRLFRQTAPGDWSGVFLRMARELLARVGGS